MQWKKIAIIALDIAIAAYLVLAVTAFNKPDEKATVCSEVVIDIEQSAIDGFLNADDIKDMLVRHRLYPYAKSMKEVNTRAIEELLRRSPFVEQVECYKTQSGHVCIELKQRMPVARIMADNGENYYMDTHGNILPGTQYPNNVIVVTGSVSRNFAKSKLFPVVSCIMKDRFWQNQAVQLNILPDETIELIPRVGEHVAYLGNTDDIERKLERLRKFYKYGLNAAGWNKYSYVSVEFSNQIVCKKKPTGRLAQKVKE